MDKSNLIFKLHLELVDNSGNKIKFSKYEKELLFKHAHMQNAFSRNILVPGDLTLRSLNYVIQRLYGWENSHLHKFSFAESDFMKITHSRNQNKILSLLGVCLRFPTRDYFDTYCSDDYDESCDFKKWMKEKYSKNKKEMVVGDTYLSSQFLAQQIIDENIDLSDEKSFGTELIEDISISDFLTPSKYIPNLEDWERQIGEEITRVHGYIVNMSNKNFSKLDNNLRNFKLLKMKKQEAFENLSNLEKTKIEYEKCIDKVQKAEQELFSTLMLIQPRMFPVTDTLIYDYDFTDGWSVSIKCEEIILEDDNKDPVMKEKIDKVLNKHVPVCLNYDGVALLDDVGGMDGFITMLQNMYCNNNKEDATEAKEWARMMGWTERKIKEENML